MKEVKRYSTIDNVLFENKNEAIIHEDEVTRSMVLIDILGGDELPLDFKHGYGVIVIFPETYERVIEVYEDILELRFQNKYPSDTEILAFEGISKALLKLFEIIKCIVPDETGNGNYIRVGEVSYTFKGTNLKDNKIIKKV